ncbi:MAG: hypothetical protein N2595_05770, partial [bacterium]|nr:hypothetical protein [bacterium]
MKQAVWKRVAALSYTATLVVGSQIAYGGAWATLNYREINAASGVCWRSWAVMSQTNKVQGICDLGNDGIEPPTTNGPSHIASGDELSVNPATPPAVGYNGLIWSAMNQARGRVMGNIETSTTQQRQGLYRVFSDYTITGAAYYLDGPQTYMDAGAPPTSNCFGAWRVDVVNPAYVIPFDMAPVAAPAYVVTGSVYASEGGGNNQLESGWILVEWRYGNETLWREGVNTLSGDGSFGFVPALVSNAAIYVRARVKDANTPRPWFPQSAQYLLNVAYSAPPLIDITNTPMIAAPGTTSVTLGGTNVNVTSPMWWSNSVAAGGGEVNFVGNHFYVVVTNLVTGVNGIYVYGTNVFGHWTNDSVLVTVAGPNAPVVGWVVSNVLGSIGQLRDGSGTISNAFRIEDGDADVCEVFGVEYSLNKINWQVIPWAQLSGATVGLASASVLISAPAHVVRWGAREALGQSVASGWLRMRVRDAGMLVSEWAEGAFVYDGVCQNFAITAPNGGMNFATNRGAGATWTVSGTIEVGASRVRVYNLLTGGMGEDTTVGPLWDAQVSMGNGTNVLVAVGTDYYGNEARVTQTVVIADARWPFVDIIEPAGSVTNVAAERSYYEIQSTNANVTVLRVIVNGQATSYEAARTPYNFTVALGEGTNVITVEGTNELGSAEDTVRIIRPTLIVSPGAPYVEIVDPEVVVTTVPAGQTVYHVRSTNANMVAIGTILDGVMRLYTPAVSPYNFSVALREGINTVTVIGTNAAGVVAEDSVTIIRPAQPRTPGAPYVDIIDPATVVTHVPWGQVTYNVRSTNANVVALAVQINDGPAHYVALANPYNFTIALAEGITTITLSGTNAVGVRAADSVTIVRAPIVPPVPGTPYVDIIDPAEAVRYVSGTQTTYLIRSTNAHVVSIGTILNSVMQLQPAVSPYDFEIALAEGLNTITVAGTNAGGVMALDSVTIVRPRVDVQAGEPYVEITDPGAVITHVPMKQTGYLVRSTNAHVTAVGFLTNGVLQMGAAVNPYEVQMVLGVGVNTIT